MSGVWNLIKLAGKEIVNGFVKYGPPPANYRDNWNRVRDILTGRAGGGRREGEERQQPPRRLILPPPPPQPPRRRLPLPDEDGYFDTALLVFTAGALVVWFISGRGGGSGTGER